MKKAKTMQLKGNDYAKVAERLLLFREENPRALVETTPEVTETHIVIKARVLKDKKDPHSAEATGHAMELIKNQNKEKFFEKLETVALGRALANLGYAASGEIASSEEMEAFEEHKQEVFMEEMGEHADSMNACANLEELQKVWVTIPGKFHKPLEQLKNELKLKLHAKTKTSTKQRTVAPVEKGSTNGKQAKKSDSKAGNKS